MERAFRRFIIKLVMLTMSFFIITFIGFLIDYGMVFLILSVILCIFGEDTF